MIEITITGEPTGRKALIYEHVGRKGRRAYVPTYVAQVHHKPSGRILMFAVVRDSSAQVFEGLRQRYSEDGECPPSAIEPYHGLIREDGPVGFRIQLFEAKHNDKATLIGQGRIKRKHIQIHFGAAASHGCLMVAGRRRQYPRHFARPIRTMFASTPTIRVIVQTRR